MRPGRFLLVVLLFHLAGAASSASVAAEPVRQWTDAEGRRVMAQLEGFQDPDTLLLKLGNGQVVPYPIAKLGSADAAYARDRQKTMAPASDEGTDVPIDWTRPKQSTEFVVRSVNRENVPGFISTKSGWANRIRCVEAKLEYRGTEKFAEAEVRAYYFNRKGDLIERFDRVPARQNEDGIYVKMPESLPQGETINAYFPITEFHESSDLATVLVVFGSGTNWHAKTMPTMSMETLAFDEKSFVFPGWKPSQSSPSTGGTTADLELEIRRVQRDTFDASIEFEGKYHRGKPVIEAEVRVRGTVAPGRAEVKLYAFDEKGKRVGYKARPSAASIGGGTYVSAPQIANDDWHPVYFSLDSQLPGDSSSFVIVLQFGGQTVASVLSSEGTTLESLDFPEKSEIAK